MGHLLPADALLYTQYTTICVKFQVLSGVSFPFFSKNSSSKVTLSFLQRGKIMRLPCFIKQIILQSKSLYARMLLNKKQTPESICSTIRGFTFFRYKEFKRCYEKYFLQVLCLFGLR